MSTHAAENLLPDPASILCSRLSDGGGYVDLDDNGHLWQPSGRVFFHTGAQIDAATELEQATQHFFLPRRFEDPFGFGSTADFDADDLLIIRTTDALASAMLAKNDYRVLQPQSITDINGNRSEVAFDTLGMVAGSAVMGKVNEQLGDSLVGFRADLTPAEREQFFADPTGAIAAEILAQAGTRVVYDIDRFWRVRQPAFSAVISRETHVHDVASGQHSKLQVGFSYADGLGRLIQEKIQFEPDNKKNSRWIASGWTIYNNKGKPVKRYEPFFDGTHDFIFGNRIGVSSVMFYDAVGRSVATLHPNHTFQKIKFDPWRQDSWDVNDTVRVSDPGDDDDVGPYFRRLPETSYLPSWYDKRITGALGYEEQNAARKAAVHGGTPSVAHADASGRTVLNVAHNRVALSSPAGDEFNCTRIHFDIQSNQREIIDAGHRLVMRYDYNLRGNRIHQASMEAGERWLLSDVLYQPIRAWDSRRQHFRNTYDALRRPSASFLREDVAAELMIGRTRYGEDLADALSKNVRGKVTQICAQAGTITNEAYDFKGNLLHSRRQLACEYRKTLNWADSVALEHVIYASSTQYDALNRPNVLCSPDNSHINLTYNATNLVARIDAQLRGSDSVTTIVSRIDYNAKSQRTHISYGNGSNTQYAYDELTFGLMHLLTHGDKRSSPLQDLNYTYDPIGNITHIRDNAQQNIYFRNRRVEPSNDYTYDAIYRLIEGCGREHLGQTGNASSHSHSDDVRIDLPQPGDGNAMGRYAEHYIYDAVGNILAMQHRSNESSRSSWERRYFYQECSQLEAGKFNNRLSQTRIGDTETAYRYDGLTALHGNMTSMPHLSSMRWDYRDQLRGSAQQRVADNGDGGTPETTWYVYDANGQRVRKITERHAAAGSMPTRLKERIYLNGFEIYKAYKNDSNSVALERETLHIMNGDQRVVMVETRTQGDDGSPQQLMRYQFSNHIGSASLELDHNAQIVSYEEYYPYGGTSYQSVEKRIKAAAKRYRYTGTERDDESGLNYNGMRYYASWLGRWISCDPMSLIDSLNLYQYAMLNPCSFSDTSGMWVDPDLFIDNPDADPTVIGGGEQFKAENGRFYTMHDEPLNFDDAEAPPPPPPPVVKPPPQKIEPKVEDKAPPGPTTGEKIGAFAKGAAEGLATGIAVEAGVGFVAGLGIAGLTASTLGIGLLVVGVIAIAYNWDSISASASRLWEGNGTLKDYEAAGGAVGGLLSMGAAGPAGEVGGELAQVTRAAGKDILETFTSGMGPRLAPAGGGRGGTGSIANDLNQPLMSKGSGRSYGRGGGRGGGKGGSDPGKSPWFNPRVGKIKGEIPADPAARWEMLNSLPKDVLQDLAEMMEEEAIATRQAEQLRLGETSVGPTGAPKGAQHRARIEDELDLLRMIRKILGGS